MKNVGFILIFLMIFSNPVMQAQDPNAPVWGVYASGVGERLKNCMDPCWVTYTVALTTNPRVVENLGYGTMGAISTNITWREATALLRKYGRYFDDEPDGTYKCSPCELIIAQGSWHGWGSMTVNGSGNSFTGTYSDTYVKPQKGKIRLYKENGKWMGTWEEPAIGRKGIFYNVSISQDGKTISGYYDTTQDGGKGNWHKGKQFTWRYRGS